MQIRREAMCRPAPEETTSHDHADVKLQLELFESRFRARASTAATKASQEQTGPEPHTEQHVLQQVEQRKLRGRNNHELIKIGIISAISFPHRTEPQEDRVV